MKRFALLLASAAFVTPAFAADIVMDEPAAPSPVYSPAPTYNWSGLYVGGQLGGAFGGDVYDNGGDSSSLIGGAHIGYDYQMDNFVFGGLVDINGVDASTRRTYTSTAPAGTVTANQDINFLATARLKAGFAMDRAMIYGTGGLAYANVDNSAANGLIASGYNVKNSSDDFGYAVGAGVDFLATDKISVGVEYLYTNLGDNDFKVTSPAGTVVHSDKQDVDFHSVWAKASYHFN